MGNSQSTLNPVRMRLITIAFFLTELWVVLVYLAEATPKAQSIKLEAMFLPAGKDLQGEVVDEKGPGEEEGVIVDYRGRKRVDVGNQRICKSMDRSLSRSDVCQRRDEPCKTTKECCPLLECS